MIWQWFLIITVFIFIHKKIFCLRATEKKLRDHITLLLEENFLDQQYYKSELERERALTNAAIDSLAYSQADMEAVEKEMDRLDVEDFLSDIDEENNFFI